MITRKQILLLGVLLIVLVGAIAFTYSIVSQNEVREETRDIFAGAPDTVTYTDENGAALSLEDFLGQVLVVTSWASWSPFTANDLTSLNLIAADYSADEVVFMAINRKETKEQAARYLATVPEFSRLRIIIDTQDHFYHSVAGYAMPETIVFDTAGEIVLHHRGEIDTVAVRAAIDAALQRE